MNSVLKNIKKVAKNEFAFTLDDKNNPYEIKEFIDTGCLALNAVVGNGDIYSGMPTGKRICFAGPSSTAKSFFAAHAIKSFLEKKENSYVIFFESEGSSISEMAKSLDIPTDKMIILPVLTVEDFKIQSVSILDDIIAQQKEKKGEAPNFIMCLDSIGMLASEKEYKDASEGKNTVDMTRAKAVKSVFRLITLKLSLTNTTLITIAHSYDTLEMFSKTQVSGGTGLLYASDVILVLSKAKQKEGTDHIGAIITCNVQKSRYIPEGQKIKVQILFKKGMSKYSSMVDLAYEYGILKKEGISFILPNGEKVKMAEVRKNVEKYIDTFIEETRQAILDRYSFDKEDTEISQLEDDDEEENQYEDETNVDQLDEEQSSPAPFNS